MKLSFEFIAIKEITNHNCDGMCIEQGCEKEPTEFLEIKVNGVTLLLSICDLHTDEILYNKSQRNMTRVSTN